MKIGDFNIDEHSNCFIIAELSANHQGDIEIAKETIRAAKRSGANAIKLQTYTPDTITLDSHLDDFKIKGTIWEGKYLYDLYKEAYTPWEWHQELMEVAKEENIICFSSPFDFTAVDFLEKLAVPAYKIASFEITDIPLIEYVASKGKPIIISTGIATYEDIKLAIATCHKAGNKDIALLKCTSAYPAPVEEANLKMIQDFKDKFGVITGLSDHTIGATMPIVAVTLGAKIIEKHFILNKNVESPDASFSMTEEEFKKMVIAVRAAEKGVGQVNYTLTQKQIKGKNFSRSLYFSAAMEAGDIITKENVRSVRPGWGMHPKHLHEILGKTVKKAVSKGERVTWELINQ